ncbi:MAG: PQQ-dependent sugar dehydrogenase [Luteolibacter sp.]|uniref:PQQ-dependent sugar dehydrogenase n=1 Tax=Luteolibacter sp. TaxID=1962973 RepID=UPI003266D52A
MMTRISRPRKASIQLCGRFAAVGLLMHFGGNVMAGTPGLDHPAAVAPFLNGSLPRVEPTGASEWTVQETFSSININLPMHLLPYPGTNKLLCVAKEGKIFLFDNTPGANQTDTFLDLSSVVFTSSDSGMTWLVFHPEFGQVGSPNRDYVYITYKWKPAGGNGNEAFWRVARFTVILDGNGKPIADPASEQILIQQYDQQQWHDSGCMTFGPDGYLYIGIGDEGGSNDQYNDGQKINDRLFSGILRIDVDQKAGSHAIRRQPLHNPVMPAGWPESFTANYKIPADNPFNDVSGGNLEEFYAIGVRQPYRFSYDTVTNRLWLAESGQDTREELDIVTPGANFGWPFREGIISRPTGPQPPTVPTTIIGTLTEPIWDASHATDACTVGGFVYRGTAHPSLVGKFITVDNVTGHIRAHTYNGSTATNDLLTDMPSGSVYSGTSTIGWDQSGEPIFIKINGTGTRGRYFKLATIPAATTRSGWFRFEDQAVTNTSGYVSDNPVNSTANAVVDGVPLLAYDDEAANSANVTYNAGSGVSPTGFPANTRGVHMQGADLDGRPGNNAGDLYTGSKLGVLNNFTMELSFKPNTGSLAGGYQCFLGLDGLTGTTPPADGEDGPALQPFRLMRWGRTDAGATTFPLTSGDLYLNVRTLNPATTTWTTVPLKVLPQASFVADAWYHLAIVGDVAAGTLTVYRYDTVTSAYTQLAQATGYVGNLQSGVWSVGRGCYNGNSADWVTSADFDEVKITDEALPQSKFLYGSAPVVPVIPVVDPPPLLSQTGAFSNVATLTPAAGVVPYTVNAPLWSDRAHKLRWMALPNNGVHDSPSEKITFKAEGNWQFPVGTVFIKHFELPVDDTNPTVYRRLETRFVVIPESGEPFGFTYKWRPDNSDADLMPAGLDEQIDIAAIGGGTRQETWTYPSHSDCRFCHNGNAGYVLGVKPWQLNGDMTYPLTGRAANQLETLGALGWFDNSYREDLIPWMLKSHNVAETTASLTDRVRSYIDSNCSQCHQPGGVRAFFDARITTPLANQGLIYGDVETNYGDDLNRVIRPGDPDRSIMLRRLSSTAEIKMPPIAKHLVDQPAIQLFTDWINSLGTGPLVALTGPATTTGPFQVNVHFSDSVTGLTPGDFDILHGTAAGLTGSGADYVLTVNPAGYTTASVSLPAGRAQNAATAGNYASNVYLQTVAEPPAADADGLVAWYRLDETSGTVADDSTIASPSNGTLVNSPVWGAAKWGNGLTFSSTLNNRVTVPNRVGNDFSVSFWMKTTQSFTFNGGNTNNAYEGKALINADTGGNNTDFMIAGTRTGNSGARIHRITVMTGVSTTAGAIQIQGTTSVNTGQWVHVAVTRAKTSGEVKIYVNGSLQTTAIGSTATLNSNPVITLASTPADATRSYDGSLDEVRFYTKVLSQAEVTSLYQTAPPNPPAPSLIAASTAFEDWTAAWFPGIYHLQGAQSAGFDPDFDGITNFGEFAFGVNPQTYDFIRVPITRNTPTGPVVLSYVALKDKSASHYKVMVSDNLVGWTDATPNITTTTAVPIAGTDYETVTVTYTPPVGNVTKQFFSIQATQQ